MFASFFLSSQRHLRTKKNLQSPKYASHGKMTTIAGQTRKCAQIQDTSFLVRASLCHISGRSWAVHIGWGAGVPGPQSPASRPEWQEEAAGGAGENGRPVAGPFRLALPGEPRSGRGWLAPAKYQRCGGSGGQEMRDRTGQLQMKITLGKVTTR